MSSWWENKIKDGEGGREVDESNLITKTIRAATEPFLPENAQQFIANAITGDDRYALKEGEENMRANLYDSINNARTRTGKIHGSTKYRDYSSGRDLSKDINSLNVSTENMLRGSAQSPEFKAATTWGRVTYTYDPERKGYDVYDNYDFSSTDSWENDGVNNLYGEIRDTANNKQHEGKSNYIGFLSNDEFSETDRGKTYTEVKNTSDDFWSKLRDAKNKVSEFLPEFQDGGYLPKYQNGTRDFIDLEGQLPLDNSSQINQHLQSPHVNREINPSYGGYSFKSSPNPNVNVTGLGAVGSVPIDIQEGRLSVNPELTGVNVRGIDGEFLENSLVPSLGVGYSSPNERLQFGIKGRDLASDRRRVDAGIRYKFQEGGFGPLRAPLVPEEAAAPLSDERIISDHDRTWEYRQKGQRFFTRKKGNEEWLEPGEDSGPGRAIRGLFGRVQPEPVQQAPQLPRVSVLTQENLRNIAQPVPQQGNLFPEFEQQPQPQVIPQHVDAPSGMEDPPSLTQQPFKFAPAIPQDIQDIQKEQEKKLEMTEQQKLLFSKDRLSELQQESITSMDPRQQLQQELAQEPESPTTDTKSSRYQELQERPKGERIHKDKDVKGPDIQDHYDNAKERVFSLAEELLQAMESSSQKGNDVKDIIEQGVDDIKDDLVNLREDVSTEVREKVDQLKNSVGNTSEQVINKLESLSQALVDNQFQGDGTGPAPAPPEREREIEEIEVPESDTFDDIGGALKEKATSIREGAKKALSNIPKEAAYAPLAAIPGVIPAVATGAAAKYAYDKFKNRSKTKLEPEKKDSVEIESEKRNLGGEAKKAYDWIVNKVSGVEMPELPGLETGLDPEVTTESKTEKSLSAAEMIQNIYNLRSELFEVKPKTQEEEEDFNSQLLNALQGLESGLVVANEDIYQIKDGKPIYKRPIIIGKSTYKRKGKKGTLPYGSLMRVHEFHEDGTPRLFDTPEGPKTQREMRREGLDKKYGATTPAGIYKLTNQKAKGYKGWSSVLKSLGDTPENISVAKIWNKDRTSYKLQPTKVAIHPQSPLGAARLNALENSNVSNALSSACIGGTDQTNKDIELLFESNSPITDTLLIMNKGQGRFFELAIENLQKEYFAADSQKEKKKITEKVRSLANN